MSGGGLALFLAVFAVIALIVTSTEDKPKRPNITNLGPDPTTTPLIAHTAGDAMWVWALYAAAGFLAGIAFSVAAGTLAAMYPRHRWTIWTGLAAGSMGTWLLIAQHALWFNVVTGGCVMIVVVFVMDFAWGGRRASAPPPRRARTDTKDESWRDVIPESVVIRKEPAVASARRPTWQEMERMSQQIHAGVSVVWYAKQLKTTPDEVVRWVRDFRLAEDRWKDTLAGNTAATSAPSPGRDLSDELRSTGWDDFLAATTARIIHRTTDPNNDGRDVVLYELTSGPWAGERVLQVIDASREDGINRRVGIPVGRTHTDAGAALADTWGLDPEQYQPARHT